MRPCAAVALAAGLAVAGPACAQVLEIGGAGQVTVYDQPAVFDGQAVRPLAPPTPPPAPRARAAAVSRRAASLRDLQPAFDRAGDAAALSPALLSAVARRESGGRADAVSPKGAQGVMQLMPSTARDLHVDARDPAQNVQGGARYLRAMLDRFGGDLPLALAAYNAGPAAVVRYGGVPPFAETRAYVDAVLADLSRRAVTSSPSP